MRVHAVLFAVTTTVAACGSEAHVPDPNPAPAPEGSGFGQAGSGSNSNAAPSPNGTGPQSLAAFCASTGAGIVLPGTSECTGDLAKKKFRFAVCSCESLQSNGAIRTRSFDSTTKQSDSTGGSLGTNGDLVANGQADIGGSVWTAGRFTANDDARVYEELHSGDGASASGTFEIDHDYYGSSVPVALAGPAVVKGMSHVPASVAPPCDCSDDLPIASIVKSFETANDDAASGIAATKLADGLDDVDLTLECGRYYFTEITTNGKVTLRLKGRTAIFVGGKVGPNGGLEVVFEGGAELDLFVTDGFALNGEGVFGDLDAPARVRVYVGGESVGVNGQARLAGNLYAPHAVVGVNGDQATRGSIHAKGLAGNGKIDLEYDEAILKVAGCSSSTTETSGKACSTGACGTGADCCAPLLCQSGACVPSVR